LLGFAICSTQPTRARCCRMGRPRRRPGETHHTGGNNGANGNVSLRAVAGDHVGRAGQRLCLPLQGLPAPHWCGHS
jgi:hypothetical protein